MSRPPTPGSADENRKPPVHLCGRARGFASVGDLIGNVTRDLSTLMRQELALAQAEVKQEVSKTAKGAAAMSGAGLAG